MALGTIGTAANNTLSAFLVGTDDLTPAQLGLLRAGIFNDLKEGPVGVGQIYPGAYERKGFLYIPNRGHLKVFTGDYVAFDSATGWPIVVSALAAAGAGWVHS